LKKLGLAESFLTLSNFSVVAAVFWAITFMEMKRKKRNVSCFIWLGVL